MTGTLQDLHGRRFETLRVSVTDRCNFRCAYCMPEEGMEWFHRQEILSFEELVRVVRVSAGLGLRRVRITGGEPLLRKDLHLLVGMLNDVEGVEEINLTTNGVLLPPMAAELRDAGIRRVNISLDSLDRETFKKMARTDQLGQVLAGITAACEHFDKVRINAVLVRGLNDHEVGSFAELARELGIEIRFIEYMPLDAGSGWGPDKVVSGEEARERIHALYPLVRRISDHPAQPSADWAFVDGAPGGMGFINPVTEPFCGRCDRMRLTSDGKLLNCMFDRGEVDVRTPLREGVDDDTIAALLKESARAKGPGGLLDLKDASYYKDMRNMSRLGG